MQFLLLIGISVCYSCNKGDFGGITPPACVTSQVPQQISLDWTSDAPSYYEVSSTNAQVPCTLAPFYDESSASLNDPPYATDYNYTLQASAIPSSALIPSSPTDHSIAGGNELGITQSNQNYLCQITVLSEEPGQDDCTYNGSGSSGPVLTALWSKPGTFESAPMYEFTSTAIANTQSSLNNEVVIDYFDVYSQCSSVTERPYFSGVAEIPIPVGANANTTFATVAMANQTPVTQ